MPAKRSCSSQQKVSFSSSSSSFRPPTFAMTTFTRDIHSLFYWDFNLFFFTVTWPVRLSLYTVLHTRILGHWHKPLRQYAILVLVQTHSPHDVEMFLWLSNVKGVKKENKKKENDKKSTGWDKWVKATIIHFLLMINLDNLIVITFYVAIV